MKKQKEILLKKIFTLIFRGDGIRHFSYTKLKMTESVSFETGIKVAFLDEMKPSDQIKYLKSVVKKLNDELNQ